MKKYVFEVSALSDEELAEISGKGINDISEKMRCRARARMYFSDTSLFLRIRKAECKKEACYPYVTVSGSSRRALLYSDLRRTGKFRKFRKLRQPIPDGHSRIFFIRKHRAFGQRQGGQQQRGENVSRRIRSYRRLRGMALLGCRAMRICGISCTGGKRRGDGRKNAFQTS